MARRELHLEAAEGGSYWRNESHRPERKYGGCGTLTTPEPYSGPPSWVAEGYVSGKKRKLIVTRLERSPTGSGHGAFRIDEELKERTLTHGYTCSWPSWEDGVRVATFNR